MIAETLLGAGVLAGGGIAAGRWRRRALYGELARKIETASAASLAQFRYGEGRAIPDFGDKICHADNFLPSADFEHLRALCERHVASERSYVPAHKKGGTIAFETIAGNTPEIACFYRSRGLLDYVSSVTGLALQPTPLGDQSSLSILFYDRPGDHIGWHYDHNFYRGRHFTALLPLVNRGHGENGLSHATLWARAGGREFAIATPPNRYILFEGAVVHHKVTPVAEGERRLVLSMTFCVDPRNFWWQGAARRIKDTAFFGLRALWT
ncbi:MAG: 2OG-Fe(II) oxygenase [Beijerinckiaceae bacterium]